MFVTVLRFVSALGTPTEEASLIDFNGAAD